MDLSASVFSRKAFHRSSVTVARLCRHTRGIHLRIQIDVALHYRFPRPNTVFLTLEAANAKGQEIVHEDLDLGDAALYRIVGDAGVGERIWACLPGSEMILNYRALIDITRPNRALDALDAAPLHLIPGEVAPYLRPSRYCQSDKFVISWKSASPSLPEAGKSLPSGSGSRPI